MQQETKRMKKTIKVETKEQLEKLLRKESSVYGESEIHYIVEGGYRTVSIEQKFYIVPNETCPNEKRKEIGFDEFFSMVQDKQVKTENYLKEIEVKRVQKKSRKAKKIKGEKEKKD